MAVKFGGQIFAASTWQITTETTGAAVMVCLPSGCFSISMKTIAEPRAKTLTVNEIYHSIQGESTWAGLPCVFVRLTFCDLRCNYCDTAYAFSEGKKMSLGEIRGRIAELAKPFEIRNPKSEIRNHVRLPLVELTGGEPLLQSGSIPLTKSLCDDGFTVLVETSGALDIAPLDPRVRRIMDLKCPSSGEVARNRWENLTYLISTDEIKFVIGTREDYEWAKAQMTKFDLASI